MSSEEQFKKILEKITEARKGAGVDLSLEEDLSLAIMNLVSLEEHFFFTANRTGKDEYYDLMAESRALRADLLGRMIDKNHHEGETWCVTKHLLATTMRLIEVGTKYFSSGKKEDAKKVFKQAYQVYAMFWAVRLKITDTSGMKKIDDNQLNIHDKEGKPDGKPWELEDIVNKLVNCCNE